MTKDGKMALDKIILDHVEDIEKIEDKLSKDIDNLIDNIDIEAVIDNPSESLDAFSVGLVNLVQDKYYPQVGDKGIEFAKAVRKDGDIDVVLTDDPKLNKDLLDRGET